MMNNELRPYEKYKESKNPFSSMIPEGWQESRFHNIVKLKSICGNSNEELLSVYLNQGVIKYSDTSQKQVHKPSEDMSNYQLVEPGDLVMNNQQAWRGSLGVSKHRGVVSPAYYVFGLSNNINSTFANYLFRESAMVSQFVTSSKGVGTIQRNLFYPYLKNAIVALPPRLEQDQIVKYLDHQLAKINKFIKAKKKLIAVLKEQKQAITNEAVTKGLNPDIKMKPSGIDWLGDVPEHWKIIKLKYLTKESFQYGANESGYQYENNAYRYIRITDISQNGNLKTEGALFLPEAIGANYRLRDGDILFARSGATVGKSFLFKDEYGPSSYAGYLIKFAPDRSKVLPEYVYFYTMSSAYSLWLNQVFIQSTIQNVSAEKYKNLVIPLPSLDEQAKLLTYIKEKAEVFDKSIVRILSEIELIQEYKNSLISDVVTGKVDVRNIVIEELEDEIIEDVELDEDSIDEEVFEAEDGDE